MSGDEMFQEIEAKLSELAEVDTQLRELEVTKDQEIKRIVDEYAPRIDPLTERREGLMTELATLYVDNESVLTTGHGKTAVFRSGVLSSRSSQGSLVVDDEGAAMKYLRKHGLLRRFTRMGKRTIDKAALKKHPEVVEKIPGMSIDTPEHLHIKLVRTKIELKQLLLPFRVRTK